MPAYTRRMGDDLRTPLDPEGKGKGQEKEKVKEREKEFLDFAEDVFPEVTNFSNLPATRTSMTRGRRLDQLPRHIQEVYLNNVESLYKKLKGRTI